MNRIKTDGSNQVKIFNVKGMTCEGCAGHLKKSLLEIEQINDVKIEVKSGKVEVIGLDINDDIIKTTMGF